MAIRFLCSSCAQPIEIDDEWSTKLVACPYCRVTVTAPSESQFDDISHVPTAKGLQEQPTAPPVNLMLGPAQASNRVAIAALVLAGALLAQFAGTMMVFRAHQPEMERLQSKMDAGIKAGKGMFEAQQAASMELLEESGGAAPVWMMTISLLMIGMFGCWVAAVVCGIIGARNAHRRGAAVSSLLFCAVFPVMACCSWSQI